MFGGFGGLPGKRTYSNQPKPSVIKGPSPKPPRPIERDPFDGLGVIWDGLFTGPSGYAKANREIVKKLSATVKVWPPSSLANVGDNIPQVTFLPPRKETGDRHRIIYTMMETPVVHWKMIHVMNENYDECWTPTKWNAETFRKSGLKMPIHVMPLGVDPDIYAPGGAAKIPPALRLSGPNAGREEVPSGFLFIYVCQPTFRKGIEVLLEAFHEAFQNDTEAGLIIATTAHSVSDFYPERSVSSRIWLLSGSYEENELAAIYRACKVYACTSRGEGWNLPACESAACGIPVIVPRTSVHPEIVPEGYGFFFDADSSKVFPDASKISAWFDGISFPDYRKNSHRQLVDILKRVKKNYSVLSETGKRYMQFVRSKYTWALSAKKIGERIKEICISAGKEKKPGRG